MSSGTYLSSDDSALVRRVLRRYSGERCLEIGAGNGGGLVGLSETFGQAVGTDLARPSDTSWKRANVDFVLADAASCFREGSFDLVAFNPPYLPSDRIDDIAVDGGEEGLEVALRFLDEAIRVLGEDGRVIALISSESPAERLTEECQGRGFSMRMIAEEHLFFEDLMVYEVSKAEPRRGL